MDVKDVQTVSLNVSQADSSEALETKLKNNSQDNIVAPVDLAELPDSRVIATTLRNKKLQEANTTVSSINVVSEQVAKLTALLRSVAGITSQVTQAPSDQVSKLQAEVVEIMAEIQKVGSGLRKSVDAPNIPPTVSSKAEQALLEVAPPVPTQPPTLVLTTREGVLLTQSMVARTQAQFVGLQTSVQSATDDVKSQTDTLKRPETISSEDDAFRVSVDVAKETNVDPVAALNALEGSIQISAPL